MAVVLAGCQQFDFVLPNGRVQLVELIGDGPARLAEILVQIRSAIIAAVRPIGAYHADAVVLLDNVRCFAGALIKYRNGTLFDLLRTEATE